MIAAGDYKYVIGLNADADHPHGDLDRILIDGNVIGIRDNPYELRGEDITLLFESMIARGLATDSFFSPRQVGFTRRLSLDQITQLTQIYNTMLADDGRCHIYPTYGGPDDLLNLDAFDPAVFNHPMGTVRNAFAGLFWKAHQKTFAPTPTRAIEFNVINSVRDCWYNFRVGLDDLFEAREQMAEATHPTVSIVDRTSGLYPPRKQSDYYDRMIVFGYDCYGWYDADNMTWAWTSATISGSPSIRADVRLSCDTKYVKRVLPIYVCSYSASYLDVSGKSRNEIHTVVLTGNQWLTPDAGGKVTLNPASVVTRSKMYGRYGTFTRGTPSGTPPSGQTHAFWYEMAEIDYVLFFIEYSSDITPGA